MTKREIREHDGRIHLIRRLVRLRWHGAPQRRDEVSYLLLDTCLELADDDALEKLIARLQTLQDPRVSGERESFQYG